MISSTVPTPVSTTVKPCDEMQAVDEPTAKQITVIPKDIPEEQKPQFQPTSPQGVSFPDDEKTPTIVVTFGKPAEVHSITIPRNETPDANTQKFIVTFYSPDGNKINEKPIESNTSPKYDNQKPATLNISQIPSNTPVSRVEITVVETTDDKSPKGVVLDIKACTEITTS